MINTIALLSETLREHVKKLADEIGERNWYHPKQLNHSAEYIEKIWKDQGYTVKRYPYDIKGIQCNNLEITHWGVKNPDNIILIGAHYDSVKGSPGANDNASGIASLLEISKMVKEMKLKKTIRFVAFVNEEPPFFTTSKMGSRVYAKMAKQRKDKIQIMICLETMGYYSNQTNSQVYPPPFNFFYPNKGNFIGFVSNIRSRSMMKKAISIFKKSSKFPVESVATFEWVPGVDWSDHGSFWKYGYKGFMVTDTAPYRYPYYHSDEDTFDKIDYKSLAKVTEGLIEIIREFGSEIK